MLSSTHSAPALPFAGIIDDPERTARRRNELTSLVLSEKSYFIRTANAILRNSADAEDAVHSAFCSAWKAVGAFRGDSSLKTWFTRIVTNNALMALRSGKTNRTVFLEDNPEYLQTFERSTCSRVEDPERTATRHELLSLVEQQIEKLPPETRTVIRLHFSNDCSIETIARMRGKSRPSIVAHLHRGKAILRKKVKRLSASGPSLKAVTLH
ncbi:RNA polymerase sigma factor [Edaphobacter flagellatus]|uniref:RNA polymerase sigma factor n=1 Tax=Edaphobacter flagellatus TaxID=1933044 RepID=UPI0021B49EBC|nr:sigma-70 family RNA polymerase sigma factor [Edaphobacter flagellatus]